MAFPTLTASWVYRDYKSDGIPSSKYHEPDKVDIRRLLNEIQDAITALIAGQGGNITLPNLLIRYSITGGTANAIVATPDRAVPTSPATAVFLMIATQPNTGPVTINGKPLRTNGGEEIAAGEIEPKDFLLFIDLGDHYRLPMDTGSLRNKVAAQAAQAIAESALQQIIAAYEDFQPTILRFAVGQSVQSVDLGNPDIPAGFVRVFLDGVYQFSDTWSLADGILAPVGSWPGDGVRINMEVLMDPSSAMSFSVPVNGSVTPDKIKPNEDFGTLGFTVWTNGQLRTLRERAADVYNLLDAPGQPDPSGNHASTSALVAMLGAGVKCEVPQGSWVTEQELEITHAGQVVEFLNAGGYAYGENIGLNWQPATRLIAAGNWFSTTGKRVRTRRLFRGSESDPQDAPLSAVINVQAEGVQLIRPHVWLNCNYANTSPSNLGDKCDIGIFIGCRVGVQIHAPQVIGYFRRAGIYLDVTGGTNLPRHLDKAGNQYPPGTVLNGADGFHIWNPYIRGGRVGLAVLGAKPKSGETGYSDAYFDQHLGAAVTDGRGSFGASDLCVFGGRIYGPDHHSNRRLANPTLVGGSLNEASIESEPDNMPASMHIDGLAGNSSGGLWGMNFYGTRFATFEAFRVRLGQTARQRFWGCHIEGRDNGRMDTAGTVISTSDYALNSYGPISGTARTSRLQVRGSTYTVLPHYYGETLSLHTDTGDIHGTDVFARNAYLSGHVSSNSGEIDLRAASGSGLRGRSGNVTIISIPAGGISDTTTAAAANVVVGSGNVLQRSTSASKYKTDIQPITDDALEKFLKLEGITYLSLCQSDDRERRFSGFIADQAHQLGLTDLVHYGEDDEIEGFAYERATAYLTEIIKRRLGK